jgi:citronellol/citronellal dehydrogenase
MDRRPAPVRPLEGKTLFITGGSRGIGLAIAVRAAQDGANVAIAAKTVEPHPKLTGTIHTAAAAIDQAGGTALAIACDIRDEAAVRGAVEVTVARFGGIDILINNASAISLTGTLATPMKRFDLMFGVNVRGTFLCSQACLPHLKGSAAAGRNPHILTLAPPLNMDPKWFRDHVAYTMAKYGMSMCVLGMAEEFRGDGIGVNALWPRTVIATAAVAMIPGAAERVDMMRRPGILADAAHAVLARDARTTTGNFFLDETVLAEAGITDLSAYAIRPGAPLLPDLFLD